MVTLIDNIYEGNSFRKREYEDIVIVRGMERERQEAFPE